MDKHQVRMDDLPDTEDVEACMSYRSSLCKDKGFNQPPDMTYFWSTTPSDDGPSDDGSLGSEDAELESEDMDDVSKGNSSANTLELVRFNSIELITCIWLTLRIGRYWTRNVVEYDTSR